MLSATDTKLWKKTVPIKNVLFCLLYFSITLIGREPRRDLTLITACWKRNAEGIFLKFYEKIVAQRWHKISSTQTKHLATSYASFLS